MLELGVVADDLTGASDTGVQFRKLGLCSQVLLEAQPGEWVRDADVLVMDTDSRAISPALAAVRVKQACRLFDRLGVKEIYKKVDSTLRGNVGQEILYACVESQPSLTVIAPAFPKAGRTTVGGYQLLHGVPVSRTEFARDPQTPVHEARLSKLLEPYCPGRMGSIPLQTVMRGASAIALVMRRMVAAGRSWIICDAANESDLRRIAEAGMKFGRVLWVGSAGLAEQLALARGWNKSCEHTTEPAPCRSILVAAGSVSEVTREQVRQFLAEQSAWNTVVDVVAAVQSPQAEVRRLVERTAPLLGQANVVIWCDNAAEALAAAEAAGDAAGLGTGGASTRIAQVMGAAVAELVKLGVDGLVLTGGETAVGCCRALGATGLEICKEVAPGIPLSWILGGKHHGLPIVTKAGAFGDASAISVSVEALRAKNPLLM